MKNWLAFDILHKYVMCMYVHVFCFKGFIGTESNQNQHSPYLTDTFEIEKSHNAF